MRDIISNDTLAQIAETVDEIIVNIGDNIKNIEQPAGAIRGDTVLFTHKDYNGNVKTITVNDVRFFIKDEPLGVFDYKYSDVARHNKYVYIRIADKSGFYLEGNRNREYEPNAKMTWKQGGHSFGEDGYHGNLKREPYDNPQWSNDQYLQYCLFGLEVGKTYTFSFSAQFKLPQHEHPSNRVAADNKAFGLLFSSQEYVSAELIESLPENRGVWNPTEHFQSFYNDVDTSHTYTCTFTADSSIVSESGITYLTFVFTAASYRYRINFFWGNFKTAEGIDILSKHIFWDDSWYNLGTSGGGGTSDLDAIELTYAEYQALTPAEKTDPDKIYFITDYPTSGGSLEDLSDVDIDDETLSDGQILTYDETADKWVNEDAPTPPTVGNGTITIQKNGTDVDNFTTNQSSNKTINITMSKSDVGLDNVDNTSDANKPISTATQAALESIITETDTTNNTPYLYRASQTTGDRLYDKLVGCSFGVNQLVQNGDFASTSGWTVNSSKVSGFSVSSNVASMSISSGNGSYDGILYTADYIPYVQGHKYLVMADFKSTLANTICTVYAGTNAYNILSNSVSRITLSAANTWYKLTKIVTASNSSDGTTNSRTRVGIISTSFSSAITLNVKNVNVIDLTQMFGTAIADKAYTMEQTSAGSGIEWLKSYGFFTKSYYPYNAGSLVSVKPTAHKMVGKNLLPMTLDKIKAANTSGTWSGNSYTYNGVVWTLIIGLNNAVIGISAKGTATTANGSLFVIYDWSTTLLDNNTSYTLNGCPANGSASTYSLNVNNSSAVSGGNDYAIDSGSGVTFTTKASRRTVCRMVVNKDVVVNDIVFTPMLRLSDVTDATFEPYTEHVYPISSTDLRGVASLSGNDIVYDGDVRTSDGEIDRKYGHLDLGSKTWTAVSGNSGVFRLNLGVNTAHENFVCAKYPVVDHTLTVRNMSDKSCKGYVDGTDTTFYVKDSTYGTDAAAFKTAMSGVYLDYLATPTTESTTPFTNPQICDKNGTEEYIDSRDMPIPVGHDTKYVDLPDWMEDGYYKDFRDRVDGLANATIKFMPTLDYADKSHYIDISAYDDNKPIFGYVYLAKGAYIRYCPVWLMKDWGTDEPSNTIITAHVTSYFKFTFYYNNSPRRVMLAEVKDYNDDDVSGYNAIRLYLYRNY